MPRKAVLSDLSIVISKYDGNITFGNYFYIETASSAAILSGWHVRTQNEPCAAQRAVSTCTVARIACSYTCSSKIRGPFRTGAAGSGRSPSASLITMASKAGAGTTGDQAAAAS